MAPSRPLHTLDPQTGWLAPTGALASDTQNLGGLLRAKVLGHYGGDPSGRTGAWGGGGAGSELSAESTHLPQSSTHNGHPCATVIYVDEEAGAHTAVCAALLTSTTGASPRSCPRD
jgi:hypothetical protein